jgi:hypothetical protein
MIAGGDVDRSVEVRVLLACIVCALLVLVALAANVARLGDAISREVQRVQYDYMQHMGGGESVQAHALLLGQCVRREMLKSARAGFVQPESWAMTARIRALPRCANGVPSPAPATPPVVPTLRTIPLVAAAPPAETPFAASQPGHRHQGTRAA